MISHKMMTKIMCAILKKNYCKKDIPLLPLHHFFHKLLTSKHMIFPVQFGTNWHLWVFQKDARNKVARSISAF